MSELSASDIFSDTYVAETGSGKSPFDGVCDVVPIGDFYNLKDFGLFVVGVSSVFSLSFAAECTFFFRFSFFLVASFAFSSLSDLDSIREIVMPSLGS